MHRFSFRERHGIRAFWHFAHPNEIKVEFYWWNSSCRVGVDVSDEDWTLALAFPPFALYFSLAGFGLWKPTEKHIFTWDNNREVWLTDQREFNLAVHDWTIWLTPWGRRMEWRSRDPWWVRGVSLNIPNFLLGRATHTLEVIKDAIPVHVSPPPAFSHRCTPGTTAVGSRPSLARHRRG